jgi:TRAP-type uncharacterized transport system substrate-binding protein
MPPDVDPAMAVSVDAVASVRPVFRLCTGISSGNYTTAARMFESATQMFDMVIVPTNGSLDNLEKVARGECDGALVQRDVYWVYADKHPGGTFAFERAVPGIFSEFTHLLCNRKSNVDSVEDLSGDKTVLYIGEENSGASVTWAKFIKEETDYIKTPKSKMFRVWVRYLVLFRHQTLA